MFEREKIRKQNSKESKHGQKQARLGGLVTQSEFGLRLSFISWLPNGMNLVFLTRVKIGLNVAIEQLPRMP